MYIRLMSKVNRHEYRSGFISIYYLTKIVLYFLKEDENEDNKICLYQYIFSTKFVFIMGLWENPNDKKEKPNYLKAEL